ncbi:TonB-dependent receptor [Phenylobacterium sp.]|uniref:TonB-dependent receptor n=1 Tax=Phenylobacterium sp. TaxID=1871053 RepID=UPI0035B2A76F
MSKVQFRGRGFRSALLSSLTAAAMLAASPAWSAGARTVSIPAGDLEASLAALSAQTGDQLVFAPELVRGRSAPAVSGRLSTEEAIRQLVGSGAIVVARVAPRMVVLKLEAGSKPPVAQARPARRDAEAPHIDPGPFDGNGDDQDRVGDPAAAVAHAHTVSELRVTGSHIRGGSPAAPVVSLDRDALERTGHATVAAALQTLPQNFSGQSTEGTVTTRADGLGTNSGYGTSVNLRGLGSDATLVLVNGRRMAGAGNKGDFTDLSSIPTIAVERVEVLLDGASALYGSDAVGGVVNVILRERLQGGEVRLRGGLGEGGTPREGLLGGAVGRAWSSGSLLGAFEVYRREALSADDRDFAATSDLRARGGADRRDTFSFPGNILRTDPATGASSPYWAIPGGQSGIGLAPASFSPGTVNRFNQNQGVDLLPSQRRSSAYVAWRQHLGSAAEFSGDVRHSFRSAKVTSSPLISTLSISRSNPFFVSPNGAASHQVQYAFAELPSPEIRATTESLSGTFGVETPLFADWRGSGYGAFAQEIIEGRTSGALHALILSEALGNRPDSPATAYSPVRDGYFNPFAGQPANTAATLAAIGSGFSRTRFRSRVASLNGQADGALFVLPGGEVKAAVGAQVRRETFRRSGSSYVATVAPQAIDGLQTERTVTAVFAEVRTPLIGAGNRRRGVERLELSAALRGERYSDFGETVNPRVGLQWVPIDGLLIRGTYGESYRAPALQELAEARSNGPVRLASGADRILSLALQGGNPDLGPETAKTLTLGADWSPTVAPGLKVSATWFSTTFKDRIDRPAFTNRTAALTDVRLSPFVRRISPASNAADLAYITALLAEPFTSTDQGVFAPTDYGAVVDMRYVNTAGLKVSGLDLLASYSRPAFGGELSVSANASRLLDYDQAITPAARFVELLGQPGFPARTRARATLDWSRGSLGLGVAGAYMSGFRDVLGHAISEQATLDAQARWTFAGAQWEGLTVSLNVRNLLDARPPFYDNPSGFGFDPAAADVVGRFAAIQLTRRW